MVSDRPITFEPAPYRVRAWKDGRVVIDTREAKLTRGVRHYLIWMFPRAAVELTGDALIAEHDGHVAVDWDAVDEWWEEDERVPGKHPRDMAHRVEARRSSRHIVVKCGGEVVVDSRQPVVVAETGLTTRYYVPRSDVRFERLRRSDRTSWCPYKGRASYYDVGDGAGKVEGTLWSYEQPIADAAPALAGLIGIWHEKLEATVDGEPID